MDANIINTAECERELEVVVDAAELAPHFEKAYSRYRPKVVVKGFRKGKAPVEMIKRLYGESIEYDSLDDIANKLYRQVAEEKKLKVIGEPVLIDMDYKRGESLRFRIKYEIPPEIKLKEYKGLKVEKPIHRVTDNEIEDEIERLRHINRTLTEVERASDEEHILTVDLQELDRSGFALVGKKSENMRIYLRDRSLHPKLKESLLGAESGRDYRVRLNTGIARGIQETNLLVKVKKVEKVHLPELSEEFIKKITKGRVTSVAQFRENVKKDLEDFWKQESERELKDAIIGEIVRRHEFTVPEGLVKFFLDSFIEEIRKQQPSKKLPADFNEEEFRKENRAHAIWQAKWLLLKEKIIEVEKITVSDTELASAAAEESRRIGVEEGRLLNYYKRSKEIHTRLLSDKLMNFLISHAEVRERVVDEPRLS